LKTLFDPLEKLIIEHGSAVIQEKHIALLKTQFSILEKENAMLTLKSQDFESKVSILEAENQNLKLENATKDEKIEILEKRIEKIKSMRNKSDPKLKAFT
jgi:FtsZ-binding cell division protein ZapB